MPQMAVLTGQNGDREDLRRSMRRSENSASSSTVIVSGLGLKDLAASDEEGGDDVTEPMQ